MHKACRIWRIVCQVWTNISSCAFLWLGLPETSEASSQSNQRLPSISSDTRQLSSESLESEAEVGSLATVPAIMVTPVTEVSEESAEQNVPVSQAHPESLDPEVVVELLEDVDALKEGDEAEVHDVERKERLVQGKKQLNLVNSQRLMYPVILSHVKFNLT